VQDRTVAKNQLHAEEAEAATHRKSIVRIRQRIMLLDRQTRKYKQTGLTDTAKQCGSIIVQKLRQPDDRGNADERSVANVVL
jgi:hypothetical protein